MIVSNYTSRGSCARMTMTTTGHNRTRLRVLFQDLLAGSFVCNLISSVNEWIAPMLRLISFITETGSAKLNKSQREVHEW